MPSTASGTEFARQLELTADWLNRLALDKLARPGPAGSIAEQAHELAQRILDLQLELDAGAYPDGVPRLPQLRPHAAGSQLRVIGHECGRTLALHGAPADRVDGLSAALLELRKH